MTILVTMKHVRAAKMCSRGTRDFFKRHNLDWDTFIKSGIPAEDLEATKDAMATRVAEIARGRQ